MRGVLTLFIGSLAGFGFWLLVVAAIAWHQRDHIVALKANWPVVLVQTKCPPMAKASR
jgi:hypothetical protein